MSNILGGCHDARDMKEIEEIMCPKCHTEESIELILKEGCTLGESICDACGYTIEEGTPIADIHRMAG